MSPDSGTTAGALVPAASGLGAALAEAPELGMDAPDLDGEAFEVRPESPSFEHAKTKSDHTNQPHESLTGAP
jgi:hypothetical protein